MKLEKVTDQSVTPTTAMGGRWYHDACGAAHALEIVGERWALLVMRELFWGPKRFGDLKASLQGISANVLTQRLESLEAAGVVQRRRLPPPASVQVYALTPWGQESEPIFQVLGRWAARSPDHDPTLPLSVSSLMLSFRTMFDARKAAGRTADVGFRLGAETFRVRVGGGALEVARGDIDGAEATIIAPEAPAIAAVAYGGQPLAALQAAGAVTVEGDAAVAGRFLGWFTLPDKAEKPA
ncbi:transcriptional regulator [Brevundimonas sp. Leaf363]|uniref:winged helix-turn-helix transcriptional regulator n=1 Tax=Brevundimonas sp. Leaf363 TaxID=1736353 RepID=UPI0006F89AF3|nr:winged helix-turn-helix transcriptional regulator [Brevundimonas sp. Leaf363]KQS55187.1 transcriptional regulator [Brevundimonas sp. Leaf363]